MRSVHELSGNFGFLYPATSIALDSGAVWIQVAEVGDWYNPRIGNVPITPADLRLMAENFKSRKHPIGDVQLPVDYEHLSTKPDRRPGDGEAAGWFEDLELRAEGNQLWGKVSWLDEAAEKIKAKKYKYFSPTFNPNWNSLDGKAKDIGPTLIGGALTNYPTLPGCVVTCSTVAETDSIASVRVRKLATAEDISFTERERRVREALDARYPIPYRDGSPDWNGMVMALEVLDDRVIFSRGAKKYRQLYRFGDDLSVIFEGEPVEVIYQDVALSSEVRTMKLKNAQGQEVEIPDASVFGALGGVALDALVNNIPSVKELHAKASKAPEPPAELSALQTELKTLSLEVNTLKADNTRLTNEAAAAAVKALDAEMSSLMAGGWMKPAEVETMKELATSNRALFDKMIAQRKTDKPLVALNTVHGSGGAGSLSSAVAEFDAAVEQYRKDNPKTDWANAMREVARLKPDLARLRNAELSVAIGSGGVALSTAQ